MGGRSILRCLYVLVVLAPFQSPQADVNLGTFTNDAPFTNTNVPPENPAVLTTWFELHSKDGTVERLDYADADSITNSRVDSTRPTKIIIHGFTDSIEKADWMRELRDAFHDTGDYNVIFVDWSRAAQGPHYNQAASNTRVAGAQVARLIDALHDTAGVSYDDVHLIAHSMGTHTAGHAGTAASEKIGRITGLDPCGPMFEKYDPLVRLDPSDAKFVDIIHTNAAPLARGGIGTQSSCGHVDFWVNNGKRQPGCPLLAVGLAEQITNAALFLQAMDITTPVGCNHAKSRELFIESVRATCTYPAVPCDSFEDYTAGKCTSCGEGGCNYLGLSASPTAQGGDQHLVTRANTPCDAAYHTVLRFKTVYLRLSGEITVNIVGDGGIASAKIPVGVGEIGAQSITRVLAFSAAVGTVTEVSASFRRNIPSSPQRINFDTATLMYIPDGESVTLPVNSKDDTEYRVVLRFKSRYFRLNGDITVTIVGEDGLEAQATFLIGARGFAAASVTRDIEFSDNVGKVTAVRARYRRYVFTSPRSINFDTATIKHLPDGDEVTVDIETDEGIVG